MQGQRGAIGSLPDSINIDYGSLPNGVDVDEQIFWNNLRNPADTYTGNAGQEGQNLRRWGFGDLSSTNPENQVNHDERMTQSGWSPSISAAPSASLRMEEWRYEPANPVSQAGMDLNLSSNQIGSGPAFVRRSDSGSSFHNQNMNERQCRRSGNCMDYPSSSKSVRSESKPSASSSSDPFASSSGSGGFLLEEDAGRFGCSMDGRRLSCKRKTLEGDVGQSSSSEGFLQRIEGGAWPAVPPQHNAGSNVHVSAASESSSSAGNPVQVNPRLGLDLGGGVSADSFRVLNAHEGPDSSCRTYNIRMNMSDQQDDTPSNSFLPVPAATGRHPDISLVHQPFRNVNPPLDLVSPIPPDNSIRQNQSVILRVPTLRRNVQSLRWNGGPNFRPGSSASSAMPGERDNVVPEDSNPRNASRSIADHLMLVPPGEGRSSTQNVTNWGMSSGYVGVSRNVASTSRSGSSLGSENSSGPSWVSYRHPQSHYSRRLSEYVRRSLLSTVASENPSQIGNNNQHHSGLASSQETIHPPGARNDVHSQPRSSSAVLFERQGDGVLGFPYSLRALAAAGEGRSRLVSEIRNVLDIMRRGEGLRFEDVMVLDQSVFFGMAGIHDRHRDMRLDVDNMSYEELLALEERIGNVCTGLSEETILKRMKQHKFTHTIIDDDDHIDAEPCCVCQETYNDGQDLGILDCGHCFHRDCIKQWLVLKNLCPICKTTALAT